jgi:hypothetical protein
MGRFGRVIALLGWVALVALFLRVASGGGTMRGVGYVITTEEPWVVALVAASLAVGILAVALLADASWAWRISTAGGGLALATSVVLAIGGHDSAILAGFVSGALLAMGIVRGRAPA